LYIYYAKLNQAFRDFSKNCWNTKSSIMNQVT